MDIAPKSFEKNVIGSDGKLTSTQTKVYGKKIPLKDIIQSETKRLHAAGILNIYSDDLYTSLSLDDIKIRFQALDPMRKMFQNASSLKPLGQLKPNCPGMIIGRSSTKFMFFMG